MAVIFVAVAPPMGMMFVTGKLWLGLLAGLLAMAAAWFSWGVLFLNQTKSLLSATHRLAAGDLAARTGLAKETGELGELARGIDQMAASLEQQVQEREQVERTLLNRTHQQTVVAALGQFAMASNDFDELLNQSVNFIAQTMEIEYAGVWEMQPDGQFLNLRAGVGWKFGSTGSALLDAGGGTMIGHMFTNVEPLVIEDLRTVDKFPPPRVPVEHGVISTINTIIAGGTWPFGVLGVYSTNERKFTEDEIHFLIAIATVLAMAVNRRQTEGQLQKLASFAQFNPNPVFEFDGDGSLTYFNDAALTMAHQLGMEQPHSYLPAGFQEIVRESLATGKSRTRLETRPGNHILSWSFFPIAANHTVHCYVGDITERANLEAQLRQSQKMESVGQLAAGVAHDFNNMLTIIQGHSGIMMARPNLPAELLDSAQAIYFAAERAASLTRQLLMFSRKNIMQPKLLDLKEVVGNMTKMFQRLLGEQVTLKFVPPAQLPAIRADTGMMEQVIMNLAVNARDAMPKGGTLTINLTSHNLEAGFVSSHPQARPGHFVRLEVTDTGMGMSPETQARIFEPFFTTKEVGKGTGLGLATVYGIVKQHEGWIEVSSEPGQGTSFDVFFPVCTDAIETAPPAAPAPSRIVGGDETILVVEDEPVLRDLALLILKEYGYRVLEATSGVEALAVWQNERDHIDLLLTDMVMPEGLSGGDLAEKLRAEKPALKVVCVSGYNVDDIRYADMTFLQKPYTRTTLAQTVRAALDAPAPGGNPPRASASSSKVTIPAFTEPPLVVFTRFAREWFKLLSHGAYGAAAGRLDEPNSAGKAWGGAEIREAIHACARGTSLEVSNPDSMAGDGEPHLEELPGGNGYVFHHAVPLDGEWTEVIVQFEFLRRPEGYAVVLDDIHVQ